LEPEQAEMANYRIHATSPDFDGLLPYLTVSRVDHRRVQFVLSGLDPDLTGMTVCLNLETVYRLLEGKSVSVDLPFLSCTLSPREHALVICTYVEDRGIHSSRTVSLAELALAWNMMAGFKPSSVSTL
jgi:hypothetical protein